MTTLGPGTVSCTSDIWHKSKNAIITIEIHCSSNLLIFALELVWNLVVIYDDRETFFRTSVADCIAPGESEVIHAQREPLLKPVQTTTYFPWSARKDSASDSRRRTFCPLLTDIVSGRKINAGWIDRPIACGCQAIENRTCHFLIPPQSVETKPNSNRPKFHFLKIDSQQRKKLWQRDGICLLEMSKNS